MTLLGQFWERTFGGFCQVQVSGRGWVEKSTRIQNFWKPQVQTLVICGTGPKNSAVAGTVAVDGLCMPCVAGTHVYTSEAQLTLLCQDKDFYMEYGEAPALPTLTWLATMFVRQKTLGLVRDVDECDKSCQNWCHNAEDIESCLSSKSLFTFEHGYC